jgi:hypothetical protein
MFDWLVWDNPVAIWWIGLVAISICNILFWFWSFVYFSGSSRSEKMAHPVLWLSSIYVFGCAFRSILPRADVQRITLFDTWWSSVLVGRTVATIAELAFVAQWAIVLTYAARETHSKYVAKVAKLALPLIILAEICSWYAVVTTNYLGNSIEESLWAITYTLIGSATLVLAFRFRGALRTVCALATIGSVLYVLFMVTVDVPMYVSRWIGDEAAGKSYLGFFQGIHDLNTRWIVTHDIQQWRSEIAWKTLYFSFAVWVSMALCYVPRHPGALKSYYRS